MLSSSSLYFIVKSIKPNISNHNWAAGCWVIRVRLCQLHLQWDLRNQRFYGPVSETVCYSERQHALWLAGKSVIAVSFHLEARSLKCHSLCGSARRVDALIFNGTSQFGDTACSLSIMMINTENGSCCCCCYMVVLYVLSKRYINWTPGGNPNRYWQGSTCLIWYIRAEQANGPGGARLGGPNGLSKFKIEPQIGRGWCCVKLLPWKFQSTCR